MVISCAEELSNKDANMLGLLMETTLLLTLLWRSISNLHICFSIAKVGLILLSVLGLLMAPHALEEVLAVLAANLPSQLEMRSPALLAAHG